MRLRPSYVLALVLAVSACGNEAGNAPASPGGDQDAGGASPATDADTDADSRVSDAETPGADGADSQSDAGKDADVPDGATYRNSLSVCWTDSTCTRAMSIAHGGDWDAFTRPYGSHGALVAAYDHGVDGVKVDVRVTSDNVPVIAHSSPIQSYESLDCFNQRIEQMTAAQVTACHLLPSTTETFQRLDDVLSYARGKLVVQLTVKLSTDYARAIAAVNAAGAQDFAFFEISTTDLQATMPAIAGSDQVYYLMNIGSTLSDVDVLLDTIKNPRAFMFEMDPSAQIGSLVTTRLHPAGVRAFTYDSSGTASVQEFKALFDQGFDVVSANATPNNLQARIQVNQGRGITPP